MSEGIEIRHGCQFLGSLVRALAKLPGGLGRFLPCRLGSLMSRLRHLGWNQCSHGLTSGPLESCHHRCLTTDCEVLGYPEGSALELLDGTLKLRHCTDLYTMSFTPWSLPRVGNSGEKRRFLLLVFLRLVILLVKGSGLPERHQGHPTPRRWKRLPSPSSEGVGGEVGEPRNLFPRLGVGWTLGTCLRREQA